MLRAKLFEVEIKKREEKAAAEQAAKTDIGWGHQIRSYVLQPYQMVKDLRTGVSTSNTVGVLDGDLDEFMQAALAQKAFGGGRQARTSNRRHRVKFCPAWTHANFADRPPR
jgi:peptide chain release factor 2